MSLQLLLVVQILLDVQALLILLGELRPVLGMKFFLVMLSVLIARVVFESFQV